MLAKQIRKQGVWWVNVRSDELVWLLRVDFDQVKRKTFVLPFFLEPTHDNCDMKEGDTNKKRGGVHERRMEWSEERRGE